MNITHQLEKTQKAAGTLPLLTDGQISSVLLALAEETLKQSPFILAENTKDLERMDPDDPRYDRLMLTEARLADIAADLRNVASLSSPLGRILYAATLPNGLDISRISVPFGVVGIIYEARPNVTFDVFALCLKSGNACVLKGGSDAFFSNSAIVGVIHSVLENGGISGEVVTLLPAGREETDQMLHARGFIDLIIPRGSQGLIDFVRENASIPVIETGAGICHTYFDAEGDVAKGAEIVFNAKTRRPSVCNALDCLIIHQDRLRDLPALTEKLAGKGVIIYADQPAYNVLSGSYPGQWLLQATPESFGTEFLSLKMAVKTVSNPEEALSHIARYSSRHSEAIVTENKAHAARFVQLVDAAVVYTNASTAFTDGAQFGLGAEIGISTQKLHARGPMALEELTTYKWIVHGNGQVRI
ncbi:MAG TPA: glutamate-5-semialdehyde dehydrogenase [Prolixibacteraceae bacterium]|nr:glutamate-5-semialdehyde dehydrogenase [Prolixibacteraceae bacterium]